MNVQSAEKLTNKLLAYIQALRSDTPTMYKKSQQRLTNIAITCNQIVSLISEILETEILANVETQEFNNNASSNILQSIASMEASLTQLRNFISNTSSTLDESEYSLLNQYQTLFLSIHHTCKDKHVAEISNLLIHWLNRRFLNNVNSKFEYQLADIPHWIQNIVIMYAHAYEYGTLDKFVNKFIDWCDAINENVLYGIPHIILYLDEDDSRYSKYLTLTALLLWDKLLQNGMDSLCTLAKNDGYMSEDAIFSLCELYASNLVDRYQKLHEV